MRPGYYVVVVGTPEHNMEMKIRKVLGSWQYFVKFEGITEKWVDFIGDDIEIVAMLEKYGTKIDNY